MHLLHFLLDKEDSQVLEVEMEEQKLLEAEEELLGFYKLMQISDKLKSHTQHLSEENQE